MFISLIMIRQDAGILDSGLSIQVIPSTGPQRPASRAKGKGKEIDKGEGRRKRASKKDLAPGISWPNTCGRFCAEMAKICFEPTGEVTDPETAYAKLNKFVKDDLYLSVSNFFYCDRDHRLTNLFIWRQPLVVKPLGERPCRDLEQYLTGVLNELCPRTGGRRKGVRYMLERGKRITHLCTKMNANQPSRYIVAQELENGLVAVNDEFALLEGPLNEIHPGGLDASEIAVKRRAVEQGRREAIRGSLERMTLLFRRPKPGYLWSRPQVLFYGQPTVLIAKPIGHLPRLS
jgi:hypothetical protein